ncbi:MAG TPA: hypothetical protein VH744_04225 [Terriglobales bacterium]|jgi:hypothetical protein
MPKAVKSVLTIAVVIAAFVGWKMYNKNKSSAAVREQAIALVKAFPQYDENKAYYDEAFDELHGQAFDQAYKMGGRRTSASFDEKAYLTFLIGLYHRKAQADSKPEIADALELYRKMLQLPVVTFQ